MCHADECLLPHHTGYITDAGMTGVADSVLGVKPEIIIGKLRTKMPARFDLAKGPCKWTACSSPPTSAPACAPAWSG